IILLLPLAVIAVVVRYVAQRLAAQRRSTPTPTETPPPPQPVSRPTQPGQQDWESEFESRYAVPRSRPAAPSVPWTARQVLISVAVIAAAFLVVIGGIIGLAEVVDVSGWGEHVVLLIATLALQGVMILSVWVFAVRPSGGRWASLGFRQIRPISTTLIAIAGITACQALVVGYVQLVDWLEIDFLVPRNPFESWDIDPISFAIIALSAVIIAPLFEEIFFRGFMYQAFRKTMAVWPAAILTSLIFGMAHIDPAIIIPIALVGMILLGIYRWTGNLWSSIITHAGYNAIAVTALAVQTWGG
ncbi:MAG: type II CAAX endopeptidase family protein, partial [Chloroflexi bacterium]|nr:type II CAAX endopeptidase family protein [Chloroflexota bacterium]